MSKRPTSLEALDARIATIEFPVRTATVETAWALTSTEPPSKEVADRMRRIVAGQEHAAGAEIMIVVTLHATPGRSLELARATTEFVEATERLPGALGSTLYRSAEDSATLILVERLADRETLARHMASPYFRRFQRVQAGLVDKEVEATIYERVQ